jgi:hypothetical protein
LAWCGADVGAGSADAGGRSADVGAGSADAGGRSADAGGRSADAGGRSADAGGRSADAGGRSADVGAGSADAGGRSADVGAGSAGAGGRSASAGGRSAGCSDEFAVSDEPLVEPSVDPRPLKRDPRHASMPPAVIVSISASANDLSAGPGETGCSWASTPHPGVSHASNESGPPPRGALGALDNISSWSAVGKNWSACTCGKTTPSATTKNKIIHASSLMCGTPY